MGLVTLQLSESAHRWVLWLSFQRVLKYFWLSDLLFLRGFDRFWATRLQVVRKMLLFSIDSHFTRAVRLSWAFRHQAAMPQICKAMTWFSVLSPSLSGQCVLEVTH